MRTSKLLGLLARPSAMHKIPLDGTTGTVYHRRATIEPTLTRVINLISGSLLFREVK